MVDVPDIMATLAKERPLFHSEADFQHTMAWEIHCRLPDTSVRLEYPVVHDGRQMHIDIWVGNRDGGVAVELKCETRALACNDRGEVYELSKHGAYPQGRYDFLRDIQRVEHVALNRGGCAAHAVFLTNDSSYWRESAKDDIVDAAFRVHQGRAVSGELKWAEATGDRTMKGREDPIHLQSAYTTDWQRYSAPSDGPCGEFRYVLASVGRHGPGR